MFCIRISDFICLSVVSVVSHEFKGLEPSQIKKASVVSVVKKHLLSDF